ncbi:hypothetical protein [Vibrio owensii]|uniref:hypothetical protein n=1 Tax=Vibrio owensii TaxID=696485 RepID=UPI00059748AD|nr:hypothetical protein [Vibrio owensii]
MRSQALFLLVGFSTSSIAAENGSEVEKLKETISLLKVQIASMESFQDTLISTVFWSLGTIFSLALILIGYNWISGVRAYEKEKKIFELELNSNLKVELEKAKSEIQLLAEKLNSGLNENIDEKISSLRSFYDTRLSLTNDSISRKIFYLEYNLRELERIEWSNQKVYNNCLSSSLQLLLISNELKEDWRISRALGFIEEDLKLIHSKSSNFPSIELRGKIMNALEHVPPSYHLVVQNIKDKLSGTSIPVN